MRTDSGSTAGKTGCDREIIAAALRDATALRGASPGQPPGPAIGEAFRQALSGYEVLRLAHTGAQGMVFEAVERASMRRVAIKVIRQGQLADPRETARFEREVHILGRLRHPGIVSVQSSGVAEGCIYFVMAWIEGQALDLAVAAWGGPEEDPPIRRVLSLFADICDAVHAAHLHGVTHRDLKPGNIRIDDQGIPHVLDFGLAKLSPGVLVDAASSAMTTTGQFVGTLAWASPEQIEGTTDGIDIRTDVYSLGVILYSLLTQAFPYPTDGTLREVMNNIATAAPTPPARYRRDVGDEVETIILKCLYKNRDRRYQSAGELGRDVRRYLAGEPIEAKRDKGWYMFKKTVSRHRATAMASVLLLAMIVGGSAAVMWLWRQAETQRARAEEARHVALEEAQKAAQVSRFLQDMLSAADPQNEGAQAGRQVQVRDVLDQAAASIDQHYDDNPQVRAEIRTTLARTYERLGDYQAAEAQYEAAIQDRRALFGENHPGVLIGLRSLARVKMQMGKFAEAKTLLTECLDASRRVLGPRHTAVVESLTLLGQVHQREGRLEEAERLYRQVLELMHPLAEGDAIKHRQVVRTLAETVQARGNTAEAIELLTEILTPKAETVQDDYRTVALLASLLQAEGRFEEAEALLADAAETNEGVGARHLLQKLGELYQNLGRMEQANEALRQAEKLSEEGESAP